MKNFSVIIVVICLALLGAGCVDLASLPTTPGAPAPTVETRLDLSGQGLKSVPNYVFNMVGLVELDLADNSLTGALPAEIRHLQNLQVLDASNNQMTGVPAEIGQLTKLRELDLSDNQLTGLPLELGNLKNLRRFDLRNNAISGQDLAAIRLKLTETEILE